MARRWKYSVSQIFPFYINAISTPSIFHALKTNKKKRFVSGDWDNYASKRALAWINDRNIVNTEEHGMAEDALNAAAKTYLVAALGSLAMLLYYVLMFVNRD